MYCSQIRGFSANAFATQSQTIPQFWAHVELCFFFCCQLCFVAFVHSPDLECTNSLTFLLRRTQSLAAQLHIRALEACIASHCPHIQKSQASEDSSHSEDKLLKSNGSGSSNGMPASPLRPGRLFGLYSFYSVNGIKADVHMRSCFCKDFNEHFLKALKG